jgi:hypothetical protein
MVGKPIPTYKVSIDLPSAGDSFFLPPARPGEKNSAPNLSNLFPRCYTSPQYFRISLLALLWLMFNCRATL